MSFRETKHMEHHKAAGIADVKRAIAKNEKRVVMRKPQKLIKAGGVSRQNAPPNTGVQATGLPLSSATGYSPAPDASR